ncbi:MAG TPA: DUF423 domain-containing protein [Candidatus Xenobia bacterium]|jgi:uncharacterized membrane protein YgdD (TMEM256/DUF423 family)
MNRWFRVGCALAGLGVILGAFGAHGLKGHLEPDMLAVYETGVRYHLIHALALMVLGVVPRQAAVDRAGGLLVAGIVLFSGSLYLLAVTGVRMLGAVTPFGGLAFIGAWLWLAWKVPTTG